MSQGRTMRTLNPSESPIKERYAMLVGTVAPRPIALASTVDAEGRRNLAPFSYFNVFSIDPPVMVVGPTLRGRDGTVKDTLANARHNMEIVVNLVDHDMVQGASLSSSDYPADVDEFAKAGFTPAASEVVAPPRVAEAPVAFECKVSQIVELGQGPGAGHMLVCEVLRVHIAEDVLDAHGKPEAHALDLVGRCGGNYYVRASGDALFELPKPLVGGLGIGVDAIPADIKNAGMLSANQLALLGSVHALPDETDVNEHKLLELSDLFMEHEDDAAALEKALFEEAGRRLEQSDVDGAWMTLLAYNPG
jgi:flavin reductase (DIM6/NTAB) family NADH-FMN oxidoreductase RutF